MARKPTDQVQLKLRFDERLRRLIEREATRNERSLNAEIVDRLERSTGLGLLEEMLVAVYGPVGKLLAGAHVHGGILTLRPADKERLREAMSAKVNEILDTIPEKPEAKS